jgi:hypothetical protein
MERVWSGYGAGSKEGRVEVRGFAVNLGLSPSRSRRREEAEDLDRFNKMKPPQDYA